MAYASCRWEEKKKDGDSVPCPWPSSLLSDCYPFLSCIKPCRCKCDTNGGDCSWTQPVTASTFIDGMKENKKPQQPPSLHPHVISWCVRTGMLHLRYCLHISLSRSSRSILWSLTAWWRPGGYLNWPGSANVPSTSQRFFSLDLSKKSVGSWKNSWVSSGSEWSWGWNMMVHLRTCEISFCPWIMTGRNREGKVVLSDSQFHATKVRPWLLWARIENWSKRN